jgi:hypothetical protein
MERFEQLADAITAIVRADHYMVGLVEAVTLSEIDAAYQIFVDSQNACDEGGEAWTLMDKALDYCEALRLEAQAQS